MNLVLKIVFDSLNIVSLNLVSGPIIIVDYNKRNRIKRDFEYFKARVIHGIWKPKFWALLMPPVMFKFRRLMTHLL